MIYGAALHMDKKKRIKYYDLLRIMSFCMVIFYHMVVQLEVLGICPPEKTAPVYMNTNMHLGMISVAVFFMLSGAGLTLSASKDFSLKKYYTGRFFRLLVPFYVAVLLYYGYSLIVNQYLPFSFREGVPAWRYIFTVLGMDEWVAMHNFPTFTCSIGEWFLGLLLILTVLFPLFWKLMNKFPKAFLAVSACVYVYFLYNYPLSIPMHMSLPVKGFEFILGMYFAKYCKEFPKYLRIAAVPVAFFFFVSKTCWNINYALKITIFAAALFIAASGLEEVLQKRPLRGLEFVNRYSYHLFLVHHVVIYAMTPHFASYYTGLGSVIVFFLMELLVMVICTLAVKLLSDLIVRLARPVKKASTPAKA